MPFEKGRSGNPSGSKSPSPLKRRVREMNRQVETGGGRALHEIALEIARDAADRPSQLEALRLIFPFVYRKQPEMRELAILPDQADPRQAVETIRKLLGM